MMGLRRGRLKGFVGKGAKGARAGGRWGVVCSGNWFVVVAWGISHGGWRGRLYDKRDRNPHEHEVDGCTCGDDEDREHGVFDFAHAVGLADGN
jgi:hypothetical protein